jgi:thiol-disulfide isomerase/thioredoxin
LNSKNSALSTVLIVAAGLLVGIVLGAVSLIVLNAAGLVSFSGIVPNLGRSLQGVSEPVVPRVDSQAPEFVLNDISGQPISLSDLYGQAVVINFWATWCGPCIREMPMFQKFQDQYEADLVILAVNTKEPADEVTAFLDQMPLSLTYAILLDSNGDVEDLYQVRGLPTTFFLDSDGTIRYQHIGVMNDEQFAGYLAGIGVGE